MSENNFDLVVIGGGPAGYVGAIRAAQLGQKVAVIEKRKELGGTCLNVGCIPSKALLDSTERYHSAKEEFSEHGIDFKSLNFDLKKMMERKRGVVNKLTSGIDFLFKKNKIERFLGVGKFVSASDEQVQIEVDLGNEKKALSGKKVLLATGSVPVELPILPFDEKKILSSTGALSLDEVPEHLVVVGGGYIGLEMGSVWARLGAKVTVVEFLDELLPMCDRGLAKRLQKELEKTGLEILSGTKCLGAQEKGEGLEVELEKLKDQSKSVISCSHILVSAGRRPYTEGLHLDTVGIKKNKAGQIEVNDHFQTAHSNIYAVGDLIDGPMLAHKAEEEAIAAVELMNGQVGHVNYATIPSVIYTSPELASVGFTEAELKEAGVDYKSGSSLFGANGRAVAMNEEHGQVKVLSEKSTDRILGVHILGPRASDLIAEAVALMEFSGSAEDLGRLCHAHPTLSETVKEAARAVSKSSTQS